MAEVKVRPYLTIRPTPIKTGGGMSAYYFATVKGINRMGGVVESIGKHLETTNKLFTFRNEFLIQSQAQRIKLEQKGIKLDELEEKKAEDKNRKWWRKFLDKKSEEESEKQTKKPGSAIDATSKVVKKAISPLKKFFQQFASLFEAFIRLTVVPAVLGWIAGADNDKLARFIGNILKVFNFVRKLVGFGIGTLLDGLTNLFGGFDKLKSGNLLGGLQGLLGVGQLLAGVALVKGAQYIMMPWKLIGDVSWVMKLFTDMGKAVGETEGAAKNKDIVGYVDKNGNTISKEDFERAKKSAARNDAKRSKKQGKGWSYSGGQDAIGDRYRAQYGRRKKNFLQRGAQRTRIGFNRATRGVRGQFKAAGNWMQANPAKGNAIFSVVGGLVRAGGGLMGGENAGQAVGAGLGQATGGIAGFALGNMLLPGVGGIIGSMLGSFLGEWVGTKLGPIIDPIMKPIGNAFKLGFDIIGMGISPIINTFGEFFGALIDGIGAIFQLCGWLAKAGAEVLNFAWQNSIYKKAIDGMIWVWQNKDNIGQAVKEALLQGAKGTLDAVTFNVFDFDKQNKRFAGGKVPLMAAGGMLKTDSPEVMGLKVAGSALISTVEATLKNFGLVGEFTRMAMASDLSRLKGAFGAGPAIGFGGGKIASQVRKPTDLGRAPGETGGDGALVSIVGTKEVRFLTAQPDKFTPMNDGSIRGLLADLYNGLVSLKVIGGDVVPGPNGTTPGQADAALTAADLKAIQASSADKRAAAHLSTLEASAPQHVADVYQVILNRAAKQSGGIPAVITAREQFSPYSAAIYGSSADGAAAKKYGGLGVTKKELFDLAGKPDGIQQLTKRFGAGNPSIAAKVLADFEANGPMSQNAKKFVGGAQYFMGYKVTSADRRRPDGGNFFRDKYAVGGIVPFMDGGGEVDPRTGEPTSDRMRRRKKYAEQFKKFAAGGELTKLDFTKGAKAATAARGRCTEGVILTAEKNKANIGAPDVYTSRDPNNPRGLMSQAVGRFGWGSIPGLGRARPIKSPYGNVTVNSMSWSEWQKAVKGGKIPSGALVFSTERGWDWSGGSSGNDSAIAQYGGKKLWSGHWQYEYNGVGGVYGSATKEVVALTHPGGNMAGWDGSSPAGADGTSPTTTTVTAKTSLLGGGGGQQEDVGTMLEKAFKAFREGFSEPSVAVTPVESGTPSKVQPQPSPDRTKVQKTVQQGSEEYTSREATKPKGGVAVATIPIPVASQSAQPQQRIVVNSAGPTAMVSP